MDWQITHDLGVCSTTGRRMIRTTHFESGRIVAVTWWA